MTRRFVRFAALIAPATLPILAAGCSTANIYPSLSIREVENTMEARPAQADTDTDTTPPLPSPDADLTTRIDGLLDVARTANAQFSEKRTGAERAIAAAGPRTSDSWSAAQVALSELQTSRSNAMTALAELDQLYVAARDEAPLELSPKAKAIAQARDQVNGWVADQDAAIATLSARLTG